MNLLRPYIVAVFALIYAVSGSSIRTYNFEDLCPTGSIGNATITIGSTLLGLSSYAILRATRDEFLKTYRMNARCTVFVVPPISHNLVVSVKKIELRNTVYRRSDNLTLSDSTGNQYVYCDNYFSSTESNSSSFTGTLTVDFRTDVFFAGSNLGLDGFVITVTAYKSAPQPCAFGDEFRCDNNRCISKQLTCDGHNHCGDRSDQRSCPVPCELYQFRCLNGRCINRAFVCDRDNDCGDWSDERNCGGTSVSSRSGSNPGGVAAAVFGGFFLFLAAIIAAAYYKRKRNRTVRTVPNYQSPYSITHPPPPSQSSQGAYPLQPSQYSQGAYPSSPPIPQTHQYGNPYPPLNTEIHDEPPPYSAVVK